MTARAAVVGAGPSGFYAADQLLRQGVAVDLFDALPTPYGLVRAGVAPDHPKIKSVTRIYEKTAQHADFRFFGGVEVGADVTREELLERYHAVVYAVGTPTDNRLGIPGDDRPGSVAATEFVAWYNGHPAHADEAFDLSCERAVVIGNGNVAIDVARMLVLDPDELGADRHRRPRASRRSPAPRSPRWSSSAAAVLRRPRSRTRSCASSASWRAPTSSSTRPSSSSIRHRGSIRRASPTARRNVDMLREFAARGRPASRRTGSSCASAARRSSSSATETGPVTGLRVVRNRLEPDPRGGVRAVATGEHEVIPCGLVIRSIGYRGRPLPGVPFDERRGLIRNEGGRVCEEDGTPRHGRVRRRLDQARTVGRHRHEQEVRRRHRRARCSTTWRPAGWRTRRRRRRRDRGVAADARARARHLARLGGDRRARAGLGAPAGRPRVKLVRVPEMLAVAGQKTGLSV